MERAPHGAWCAWRAWRACVTVGAGRGHELGLHLEAVVARVAPPAGEALQALVMVVALVHEEACEERDYKGLHALSFKYYKGWPSNYKGFPSLPSKITWEVTHRPGRPGRS